MPSREKRPERNPILGVSFGIDQIRVVEMRRAGSELTVTAAGSVAIPAGSMDPGSTVDPDLVAQRLRTVLKKIGATTTNAVLGVPSSGVFTRLLDIPQIPDEELEPVVAGEVAHYQMIRPDGGAFGFARLPSPDNSRDMQILVMAADDPILHACDEVARKAGLTLVAKEPAQLGAIRAAFQTNFAEPTLIISIEEAATEIAVVDNGKMMLYRRIDVGGRNLLSSAVALAGATVGGVDSVPRANTMNSMPVDEVLSARLATEIRRSMDYHRRQFPQHEIGQAVLASMDSRLNSMAEYLEGALGMQCRIAVASVRASGAAASELGTPIASEYFSSIGLAAGELGYGDHVLPTIDLVPSAPRKQGLFVESGKVIASVAVTAVIVAVGLFGWYTLSSQALQSEKETSNLKEKAVALQAELAPKQAHKDMELRLLSDLSKQGTPFPVVMDAITLAMDPGVGINEIHFDGTHVRLGGESKDESALVNTLNHIRDNSSFTLPLVDNFQNQNGAGLVFNISSDYLMNTAPPQNTAAPIVGGGSK
jgi:type IV pilus assembly protein PilM